MQKRDRKSWVFFDMFIFGYFLLALGELLGMILNIFSFLLVVRCILSWVHPFPYQQGDFLGLIYNTTDFILDPIKKWIPSVFGGIDMSPFLAFLIVYFFKNFFVRVLITAGHKLL